MELTGFIVSFVTEVNEMFVVLCRNKRITKSCNSFIRVRSRQYNEGVKNVESEELMIM